VGPKTKKLCCSVFDLQISPLRQCKHGCKKEEKRRKKKKKEEKRRKKNKKKKKKRKMKNIFEQAHSNAFAVKQEI
jgi:hypothetical protein